MTPAKFDTNGFWYRNFQYAVEQERGLDFAEDLFSPFALTFRFEAQRSSAALSRQRSFAMSATRTLTAQAEIKRRSKYLQDSASDNQLVRSSLGRRSVHRRARALQDGHRRLSLVQRLGSRHDDCAAGLALVTGRHDDAGEASS